MLRCTFESILQKRRRGSKERGKERETHTNEQSTRTYERTCRKESRRSRYQLILFCFGDHFCPPCTPINAYLRVISFGSFTPFFPHKNNKLSWLKKKLKKNPIDSKLVHSTPTPTTSQSRWSEEPGILKTVVFIFVWMGVSELRRAEATETFLMKICNLLRQKLPSSPFSLSIHFLKKNVACRWNQVWALASAPLPLLTTLFSPTEWLMMSTEV